RIARVAWGSDAGRVESTVGDTVIDAARALVIPGLVDAHSHFYGTVIPGLIDRLPLAVRRPFLGACTDGWTERDTWVATMLGVLRAGGLGAAPSPPGLELVERGLAIARRWHGAEGRVSVCLSPWAPFGCSDEMLTLVAEASATHRLPVHTHLLETRPQAVTARRLYGRPMVEPIGALGSLSGA